MPPRRAADQLREHEQDAADDPEDADRKRVSRPARIAFRETSSIPAASRNGRRRRAAWCGPAPSRPSRASSTVRPLQEASSNAITRSIGQQHRRQAQQQPRADEADVDRQPGELRPPGAGGGREERERPGERQRCEPLHDAGADEAAARCRHSNAGPRSARSALGADGPLAGAWPSDSRKPARGVRVAPGPPKKPPIMSTAAAIAATDGARALTRLPGELQPSSVFGHRGHGDDDPRWPPSGGPPSGVRVARSLIRRGGSGSIRSRPATRETRSPRSSTTSSVGAARPITASIRRRRPS